MNESVGWQKEQSLDKRRSENQYPGARAHGGARRKCDVLVVSASTIIAQLSPICFIFGFLSCQC
jgi:hypothetical protein